MNTTDQLISTSLPTEIEIGGLSKDQLLRKVFEAGYKIEANTFNFIRQINFPCTFLKKTVKLAYKTAMEMGLGEEATYGEIEEWVRKNGKLCDKDLALWLRLVYVDQPKSEWIAVMSEPTPERYDNDKCTLHVINSHNGKEVAYCAFRKHHKAGNKIYCYVEE